jgi:guanylate kinase
MNRRPGLIFIVSAPSGGGKSTLCSALRRRLPDLRYSVSTTTRRPRRGETHGVDYFFVSSSEFEAGIAEGRWAEWARVHGHYYGTSAAFLRSCRRQGTDVLLDIDVQGSFQIVKRFPESITIFIMPPSMDVLAERLEGRGDISQQEMRRRLAVARREIQQRRRYKHVIVNDRLSDALERITAVVEQHRQAAGAGGDG